MWFTKEKRKKRSLVQEIDWSSLWPSMTLNAQAAKHGARWFLNTWKRVKSLPVNDSHLLLECPRRPAQRSLSHAANASRANACSLSVHSLSVLISTSVQWNCEGQQREQQQSHLLFRDKGLWQITDKALCVLQSRVQWWGQDYVSASFPLSRRSLAKCSLKSNYVHQADVRVIWNEFLLSSGRGGGVGGGSRLWIHGDGVWDHTHT